MDVKKYLISVINLVPVFDKRGLEKKKNPSFQLAPSSELRGIRELFYLLRAKYYKVSSRFPRFFEGFILHFEFGFGFGS